MLTATQRQLNAMHAANCGWAGLSTRPAHLSLSRRLSQPITCQPSNWTFFPCGGLHWALHFEPSLRDVRQWRVFRDGQPWMCAGLERVWRAMQTREMRPALGRRHWR